MCLNDENKARQCYSHLKFMIQAHLHIAFSKYKTVLIRTIFKQRNMTRLVLKVLQGAFYNTLSKKRNSTHCYNRKTRADVPSYYSTMGHMKKKTNII